MEIQYVYVKTRSQFGKQCIFDDEEPTIDENILPNYDLMNDYIFRNPCHVGVQNCKQFAVHEAETSSALTRESGMSHTEGGWPKEMNSKDDEATARFRRRVEKDDIWPIRMRKLLKPMERFVLQNNAVDIYENFFDDMVKTELTLPLYVRTINVYEDPQTLVRPITHLSWSPDRGKRLAVSYCSREFERESIERDLSSYIWEIENPNEPFMALKAFCPSVTIEFNPRDPSMLISGLLSGQVCNWDIRLGDKPVQMSHLQFSHRNPTNLAFWINSKTNTEFFSASTGGGIKWWDVRKLREPTETLVMDLENPLRGDPVRAIGVASLNFESTMGTKFMAGMENGMVVNGTRKGKNAQEKLAQRFACHAGPVIALDRNPFSTKNFLTVGGWVARIWAEDTKEGYLTSIKRGTIALTGGCWSKSRYSVFYLIDESGVVRVYDLLAGIGFPVKTIQLCEDGLGAITPHEDGNLLAVGSEAGNVYLVEASEALTTNARNDKILTTTYLDRSSRYVKAVDNRLKEMRLVHRLSVESRQESVIPTKVKSKGAGKDVSGSDKKADEKNSKDGVIEEKDKKGKGKVKKVKELVPSTSADPELEDAEARYYDFVNKEKAKYAEIAAREETTNMDEGSKVGSPGDETRRKRHEDSKVDKESSGAGARRPQLPDKRDQLEKGTKGRKSRADKLTKTPSTFEEIIILRKTKDNKETGEPPEKGTPAMINEQKAELEAENFYDREKGVIEKTRKLKKARKRDKNYVKIHVKSSDRRIRRKGTKITKACTHYVCKPDICCVDQSAERSQVTGAKSVAADEPPADESETDLIIDGMLANLEKIATPEELGHLLDPPDEDVIEKLISAAERPRLLDESVKIAKRQARQRRNSIIRRKLMRLTKPQRRSDEKNGAPSFRKKFARPRKYLEPAAPTDSSFEGISDADEEEEGDYDDDEQDGVELEKKQETYAIKVEKVENRKKVKIPNDCRPFGLKFDDKEIKKIIGIPDAPTPSSRPRSDETKMKIISTKGTYPRISAAGLPKILIKNEGQMDSLKIKAIDDSNE